METSPLDSKIPGEQPWLPDPLPWPVEDTDEGDDNGDDDEDDEEQNAENENISLVDLFRTVNQCPVDENLSSPVTLETLGPDESAAILMFLSVQEIEKCSALSKSLYLAARNPDLWQQKFSLRWNYDNPFIGDWFSAYQQAYKNIHDLWVIHENCTQPCDGLLPGRCCIQPQQDCNSTSAYDDATGASKQCPNCRYHPIIRPNGPFLGKKYQIKTAAQAIQAATQLRIHDCSKLLPSTPYDPKQAERAFTNAATFHRKLDTRQYHSGSLHFLSDLLFFQVNDSCDENFCDEASEINDWKEVLEKRTLSQDGRHASYDTTLLQRCDPFEPALHCWHTVRLINPDFTRPLVWMVSIQRPDCFTVFPSEGLLLPGESRVIVFGVKPFGSLLAHTFHQINLHREVDDFWGNLYSQEGHLPYAPYLIHYHYTSVVPCRRAEDSHDHQHSLRRFQIQRNDPLPLSPWQLSSQCQQPTRTFSFSAHVHGDYPFSEFQRKTLVLFSLSENDKNDPIVFCAPQLMEYYPSKWRRVQNLCLEHPCNRSSAAHKYRTELSCRRCGVSWGARLEEMGQAFVVCKLECERDCRRRRDRLRGFRRLLCFVIKSMQEHATTSASGFGFSDRHQTLICCLHKKISRHRGSAWLEPSGRRTLLQWEILLDSLSRVHLNHGTEVRVNEIPWRHAGVFRYGLCTESIFDMRAGAMDNTSIGNRSILWKQEPHYLRAFAHLACHAGKFCLGQQEDPNHLESMPSGVDARFFRRKSGESSDLFMDDALICLQAAICILFDPRSLMVHGVFDRVVYPGNVVRRCRIPDLPPLDEESLPWLHQQYVASSPSPAVSAKELTFFQVQDSVDMECLLTVLSFCDGNGPVRVDSKASSTIHFLLNFPPLGSGRFAFYQDPQTADETTCAVTEDPLWFLAKKHADVIEWKLHHESADDGESESATERSEVVNLAPNFGPNIPVPRGPRVFNLLWFISAHLGWNIEDNQGHSPIFADRRILIAGHWLSISIMIIPLLSALLFRCIGWIPAKPMAYSLEALPFEVERKMSFLTESDCMVAAILVTVLWASLGRHAERYTNRTFVRALMELPCIEREKQIDWRRQISVFAQRTWDSIVPLFFQRMVFLPQWNCIDHLSLMKKAACWRNSHHKDHRKVFQATAGLGVDGEWNKDLGLTRDGLFSKILVGVAAAAVAFYAASPYFVLNLLCVCSSSISLGMSMSLKSMESSQVGVSSTSPLSLIKAQGLHMIAMAGFHVGQLVGSSGGVLFVAEFIVTSTSLLVGGAGTISASAMDSWFTFSCLAIASFPAYVFARVAVVESFRKKKCGFSSAALQLSLLGIFGSLFVCLTMGQWETVSNIMIVRPTRGKNGAEDYADPRQLA